MSQWRSEKKEIRAQVGLQRHSHGSGRWIEVGDNELTWSGVPVANAGSLSRRCDQCISLALPTEGGAIQCVAKSKPKRIRDRFVRERARHGTGTKGRAMEDIGRNIGAWSSNCGVAK